MDCKTIMAPINTSLYTDELAEDVIDFMVEKHMGLVPVIERDGTFAGLISGDNLMKFLLPQSLSSLGCGHLNRRFKIHRQASYLNESASEMRERLDNLRHRPIGELLDRHVKVAHPDTPVIDVLMMIRDKQYVVPVVDEHNKLVGAISFFSVLYGLNEAYDRETTQKQKQAERDQRKRDQHLTPPTKDTQ